MNQTFLGSNRIKCSWGKEKPKPLNQMQGNNPMMQKTNPQQFNMPINNNSLGMKPSMNMNGPNGPMNHHQNHQNHQNHQTHQNISFRPSNHNNHNNHNNNNHNNNNFHDQDEYDPLNPN
jgi:hypothetical protein